MEWSELAGIKKAYRDANASLENLLAVIDGSDLAAAKAAVERGPESIKAMASQRISKLTAVRAAIKAAVDFNNAAAAVIDSLAQISDEELMQWVHQNPPHTYFYDGNWPRALADWWGEHSAD